jgi:hypothetical protein
MSAIASACFFPISANCAGSIGIAGLADVRCFFDAMASRPVSRPERQVKTSINGSNARSDQSSALSASNCARKAPQSSAKTFNSGAGGQPALR